MPLSNNDKIAASCSLLAEKIKEVAPPGARIMEVCGTHTVAVFRHGIRSLLPEGVRLLSGPGCPVCVTPQSEIDLFIRAAGLKGVILATFGDLIRVPGTKASLGEKKAGGADVKVVLSPLDAVKLAAENPKRQVAFAGIGFETTAPATAAAIMAAQAQGLKNFSVICAHKLLPPALTALLAGGKLEIDGLLCPGHVSVIIGARAYEPIARDFKLPCVVAGFEAADILLGLYRLFRQMGEKRVEAENAYERAVSWDGNEKARRIMHSVFEPADAAWRGLGTIPASGLAIKDEFAGFDASKRLGISPEPAPDPPGCLCGQVLTARITPPRCPLYQKACTPENPVGPCMVSSEGACAAYSKYFSPV
ncbi:MAG: hydrogenase formation protein HypD [Deltaproteobacteria bacterium]|nr:hydrogenase formation protein HypD [Deltaproteobacteria bacterium]